MNELTEPQVWVLIGAFLTTVIGMLTWQTIFLSGAIKSMGERIDARFDAFSTRLDYVEKRLEALDRDVQAIFRHLFGDDRRH